ncbi:uncharacterized protein LOC127082571 [Lathyrus oleraceus]|uniref:uncharacterized protein LOC127082571 n=1 Tax=Pisum sativum TaxID=3888 RepID=UPI0021D3198A|nr:uncharacterized protein LOC127082571 [Pisum sativum]
MACRVRPTLSDNELVDIFMGTLQGLYFEKMIGNSSTNFADMVTIGERVESGLKSGKITDTTTQQTTNKKPHGGFAKRKEGEANVVMEKARPRYQFPMAPMSYYPYSYVATAQYQQPSFQYQPQRGNQQSAPTQKDQSQQYNWAIVPKEIPQAVPPYHHKHNPNASCAYHAGHVGYSTKDCWLLKNKIQDLIDRKILTFSEEKPNVKTNPLPNHDGPTVNVVIEEESVEPVKWVDEVKTPFPLWLQAVWVSGRDQGLIQFSKSKAVEEVAVIEPITIVYRKKKVEAPPRRIQPVHFRVPTPFPYQNTKAVPWNYETTTYLGGKEIRIPDTEIVNIAGAGGMTRSGRVFAPKYTPRVSPAPTVISLKEKATPTLTPQEGATVPAAQTMTTTPMLTKVIDKK